jgi:hypothetical protein
VKVYGTVDGNFAAFGGSITLGSNALIDGDFSSMGGTVDKAPGAVITGNTVDQRGRVQFNKEFFDEVVGSSTDGKTPSIASHEGRGILAAIFGIMTSIGVFIASILIITGLGILIALLFGSQLKGISSTIIAQPLNAFGVGLLTFIAVPILLVFFSITVILLPLALILGVLIVVLVFFGWIVCGYEVGQRLTAAMKVNWQDIWATAFGTFVITLASMLLSRVIPCIGWIPGAIISTIGVGGIVLYYYRKSQSSGESSGSSFLPRNSDIPSGDYSPREVNVSQSSEEDREREVDSAQVMTKAILPTVIEMPARTEDESEIPPAFEAEESQTQPEETGETQSKGFSASILDSIKADLEKDEKEEGSDENLNG